MEGYFTFNSISEPPPLLPHTGSPSPRPGGFWCGPGSGRESCHCSAPRGSLPRPPRQRPMGAGVLSAAVAVAAEGSHATRSDPAHAAPHACARTTHACATAALRSPATPCHPVSWGPARVPPAPGCKWGGSWRPAPPQHATIPPESIRLCPHPQGWTRVAAADVGSPRGPPSAVAVGGLAEGAGHSRSCPGTGTACSSPPSLTQSWSQGSSRGLQPPGCAGGGGWSQGFPGTWPCSGPYPTLPSCTGAPPTHTPDLLQPPQWGPTACVVQPNSAGSPSPARGTVHTCTEHTCAGTHTQVPAPPSQHRMCVGSPAHRAPHVCDHNQGVTVLAGPSTVWQGSEVVAV